jgi:endonuclease/exonuclease/phosphatase family metal-dependent hydrolase
MRLRVASFNIRTGLAWDGLDSWPLRKDAAAAAVARLRADIVGLQEVHGFQQRALLRRLPGYAACGAGRDDGDARGERCAILYDTRRLVLECCITLWFSDTPDIPGSVSWGEPPPRVATLAWFAERGTADVTTGRAGGSATTKPPARFAVANVHWDGASADARQHSAEALLEWIDGGLPWIVLGDLNTTANDASVRRLLDAGLRDPLGRLGAGGPGAGTHHHWDGRTDWTRIDHVLVTREWRVRAAAVVQDRACGRLPSDHWPVLAALELPAAMPADAGRAA